MQMFRHVTANNLKLNPLPFLRELTMEAYLIENPNILILDNDNFSQIEMIDFELTLKYGRKNKDTDGRIDLLTLYNQNIFGIIELKIGELTDIHLKQLEDYFKEKNQILERYKDIIDKEEQTEIKWVGVLVGTSINENLKQKILNGYLIENSIPLAALIINRYKSDDNQILVFTETHFKNISRNFDRTKYKFDDKTYGKGRLVLAILKKYIQNNPNVTYSELSKIFPSNLQGSKGVFSTVTDANKIYEETGHKRHFLDQEDLIILNDNIKIAISSQWGIGNIKNMLKKAKELGYIIKEFED